VNRLKLFIFIVFFLFCLTAPYSFGGKEKKLPSVTVTGTVRLVGTGLFNELIISGEDTWYIAKEDREKLHNLQQQVVTVKGKESVRELKLLNNLGLIRQKVLSGIVIVSIGQ